MKRLNGALLALILFSIIACGPKKATEEQAESEIMELAESVDKLDVEVPIGRPTYEINDNQNVSFLNINDGDVLTSPFTLQMGVEGMELEPKGAANEGKGHHHLIINGSFSAMGEVIPASEASIHYGDGRSETQVELAPGEYALSLQFADGLHQSYGEKMSSTINVVVE